MVYLLKDAVYRAGKMGDVGSYVPVPSCHKTAQFSSVICRHKCEPVKLPGKPDGAVLRPFEELVHILCLCK